MYSIWFRTTFWDDLYAKSVFSSVLRNAFLRRSTLLLYLSVSTKLALISGVLIAFAGARVIKGTVNEELPEGFQKSEYVQKTGFIDLIVERSELKRKIGSILSILLKKNSDIHLKNLNETSETDIQTREAS